MHRSRLAGFIVDCEGGDLDEAAQFWAQALGYGIKPESDTADEKYRTLDTGPGGLEIEVQRVEHPSRVHLDIASDDIEAEVQRLESLGAKRIEEVRTWVVMEAPTGQRFCVIRSHGDDFAESANQW